MPELPEVETIRMGLRPKLEHTFALAAKDYDLTVVGN